MIKTLKADLEELEACRQKIREFNKAKRKKERKKPVKKSRLTKLKERLLAIASLVPVKFRGDDKVRKETEEILLKTLIDLKRSWQMNRIKTAEVAIKEKLGNS